MGLSRSLFRTIQSIIHRKVVITWSTTLLYVRLVSAQDVSRWHGKKQFRSEVWPFSIGQTNSFSKHALNVQHHKQKQQPKQCSPMEGRQRGTGQDEHRACLFKRPLVRSWFQLVKVPAHVSLQLRPPRQSQRQSQRQAACQLLPECERAALQGWTGKNYKLGRVAAEERCSWRTETST